MKRIFSILILILFVFGLSTLAFAGSDWRYMELKYTGNAPKELLISSFSHLTADGPFEKFQSNLGFLFEDGKTVDEEFVVSMGTNDDYKDYKLTFHLKYDKDALKDYDDVFITGTFDYLEKNTDTVLEDFSGDVIGHIVLFNPTQHNLIGSNSDDVGAVILRLNAPDNDFSVNFFLNPGGTGLLVTGTSPEPERDYSGYYNHESRPHIPRPSNQTDVAVGVAISTIGIAAANALTGTSIFGNASFNGSFNPASPPSPAAPAPAAQSASGGSASGFIGVIKNFFKGLFDNLRDMLTDEGRSYAGGKLSEVLDDTIANSTDGE